MAEGKQYRKVEKNPFAELRNFEETVRTESEAPHKWNETWGALFNNGVPFEYPERIAYLEGELKKLGGAKPPQKWGTGEGFVTGDLQSFKRKKMFREPGEDDE